MLKNLQIGSAIETYDVHVRRESAFGFVINWFEDAGKTIPKVDIDGKVFQVKVGERATPVKVWSAVAESNVTSFFLSVEDSTLPFDIYDGVVIMSPGGDEVALVNLRILVEPG